MWLPAADRRGEIVFLVARNLAYGPRMLLAFGLIAIGLCMQIQWDDMTVFAGVGPIFLGTLLLATRGYHNTVSLATAVGGWRPVRRGDVEHIVQMADKQKKWDRDLLDISSGRGFAAMAVIGGAVYFLSDYLSINSERLAQMVFVDAAAALLPFWVTGIRSVLKKDQLTVKCNLLLDLEKRLGPGLEKDESFEYQMQTAPANEGGAVPMDVKVMVRFQKAPEDFLGLLVQVAINSVSGSDYPYAYCVLVAKPEFAARKPMVAYDIPANILAENQSKSDTEVLVLRQDTAGATGYRTERKAVEQIFAYALHQARLLIQ